VWVRVRVRRGTPPRALLVATLACALAIASVSVPRAAGPASQQPAPSQPPPWQQTPSQQTAAPVLPPASPQKPLFSTRAEFVRVDTLVTTHGSSIAGLGADDFELRDNGVRQQIAVMDASSLPVDVAMALDVSGSVEGGPLDNLRKAATGLVDSLREGDRVALVSFNDLLLIHSPLTNDFSRVRESIRQMAATGRTSLRDAAYAALLQGDPDAGRALIVLFTDGQDVSSWLTDDALIDTAKRVNTVVYSVTLERPRAAKWDAPQDQILDDLPNLTGGRRLPADHPDRLRDLFAAIIREFRQRYILSYTPQGVDRAGYHALDVRLTKGRKGDVRARPGYFRSR
jgi:VWFA-related protein